MISASSTNRARWSSRSANAAESPSSATSRWSSQSRATQTCPIPPRACGRISRNRSLAGDPRERPARRPRPSPQDRLAEPVTSPSAGEGRRPARASRRASSHSASSPISVSTSCGQPLGIPRIQAEAKVILMRLAGGPRPGIPGPGGVPHRGRRRGRGCWARDCCRSLDHVVQGRGQRVTRDRVRQQRQDGHQQIAIQLVHDSPLGSAQPGQDAEIDRVSSPTISSHHTGIMAIFEPMSAVGFAAITASSRGGASDRDQGSGSSP